MMSDGLIFWVPTGGQRRQAALPSCFHQRQFERMAQGGSISTASGKMSTVRAASWQFTPSKWRQPCPAQGAAKRNTSVGKTGLLELFYTVDDFCKGMESNDDNESGEILMLNCQKTLCTGNEDRL